MNYYCNPLNLPYKYQFYEIEEKIIASREAADPSMVLFQGRYYLFLSMTVGFYTSMDLVEWEFHTFHQEMPVYDYAPDVRVIGSYLYFCASGAGGEKACSFYRTTDPINVPFEEIEGPFPFWDPNLFEDDDKRLYLYWGCSNTMPIYGVELNPETMKPIGEPLGLIAARDQEIGYERNGEEHVPPKTPEMMEESLRKMVKMIPGITTVDELPERVTTMILAGNNPYMEGPWMTKHQGVYYLQYAAPGTLYNVYADGVYQGESPLGPFTLAKNNPFSYKPGGFITGAGHGSTMEDRDGRWWHTSTMVISINHQFERRIGLWPAGFDADGELFCDQRFGDWPARIEQKPWEQPDWMLLSYGKDVKTSSGIGAEHIVDENIRTWWSAGSAKLGEWVEIDLGKVYDIRAVQINFADDHLEGVLPEGAELKGKYSNKRFIDEVHQVTRWKLEGSADGIHYSVLEDKSETETDLSHDLIVKEDGVNYRFIKLTIMELPYGQPAHVSGLRIFGKGKGVLPEVSDVRTEQTSELDLYVSWTAKEAAGINILWGFAPDKLYHNYMVFGKSRQKIGALIKGEPLYLRVDAFNETGIIEGEVIEVSFRL